MIAGLSPWGVRPTPLLPAALRELWNEPLPTWLVDDLKLPAGSGYEATGPDLWKTYGSAQISPRIRSFAIQTVAGRLPEILDVAPIRGPWPKSLAPSHAPFSARTRNCLDRLGVLEDPSRMTRLTIRDLMCVKGMGITSLLDFCCVVEAITDARDARTSSEPTTSSSQLVELIDESWVTQVSLEDPRFADIIPPGWGTLYDRIDRLTAEPQDPPVEEHRLASAIGAIRERVEQLSRLSLEEALRRLLQDVSGLEERRLDALERRLGTDGAPPSTLEDAASRINVTRERMRQLQERFIRRLPAHPIFLPQLDAALEAVFRSAPCSLDSAAKALHQSGVSRTRFDPRSLASIAETFGREPRYEIVGARIRRADSSVPEGQIHTIAHRQATASGASNIEQVVSELALNGSTVSKEDVRTFLGLSRDFEFLDENWYWFPSAPIDRNRLRNITRKILAVAAPVGLAELREGVHRHYRVRRARGTAGWPLVVPPRTVLAKFYAAHPEFSIDSEGNVNSVGLLDYRQEVNPTEVILVEAIRSSPSQVMDRASLAARCVDQHGMNGNTFGQYLYSSPVIAHLGTDLWSLRGVRVDPAAVEAVRSANALRPRAKRVLDHGWTDAGDLWIAARVPYETTKFVMGVPAAIRHVVSGDAFDAVDEHGLPCGFIRMNQEGLSYGGGYGSFLTRQGADEGDLLLATFRLAARQVVLRLVDDDELDNISPTDV
jgi:hypothetical protein